MEERRGRGEVGKSQLGLGASEIDTRFLVMVVTALRVIVFLFLGRCSAGSRERVEVMWSFL